MERDMVKLDLTGDSEVSDAIVKLEEEARAIQRENPYPRKPLTLA